MLNISQQQSDCVQTRHDGDNHHRSRMNAMYIFIEQNVGLGGWLARFQAAGKPPEAVRSSWTVIAKLPCQGLGVIPKRLLISVQSRAE